VVTSSRRKVLSQIALSETPPGPRERTIAVAFVLFSIITFGMMAPFARPPLLEVEAFVPTYEAAVLINDLITAVLLFGQFTRVGTLSFLILASGYLFDAFIIIPHALTFPGVFSPQGLLGSSTQTIAWLYCFWHGGFALFVLAYALLAHIGRTRQIEHRYATSAIIAAVTAALALVVSLTLLSTAGHNLLTPIINGGDYSMLVTKGVSPAICVFSVIALVFLWPRRNISTLDLWLIVVICAWLCDVMLSAVIGSRRFDLGWYAGRAYGLLAASVLLVALLVELNKLYGRLAHALSVAEARNTELLESREQPARAQRLEAMGQLTGGVAHDFNNLLMIVTGSLDIILRSLGNAAKIERLARAALDATARGQKLTQQLLTFARKQVSKPVTVNLNHLFLDFESLLRRAVGVEIELVSRLSPVLDPTHLDPRPPF
jgi:signal transduction histidine kinase